MQHALPPVQALERIAGLLEGAQGSLVVTERGDASSIPRHPNFRLFAAMNPATDAGWAWADEDARSLQHGCAPIPCA